MSRIGRKPITIPSGVDIRVDGKVVHVKGPKGVLEVELMDGIAAEVADGDVTLSRADEGRQTRAFHGLSRALLANAKAGDGPGTRACRTVLRCNPSSARR